MPAFSNPVCLATLFALVACTDAAAKDDPPLFASEAPLAVSLQADWPTVFEQGADPQAQPVVLAYADAQGAHRLDATVEPRGITRRRVCRFPPLRLRFAKGAAAGTEFAHQDSLKLVTHCDGAAAFRDYYVQE
jgi:hypothetical protein